MKIFHGWLVFQNVVQANLYILNTSIFSIFKNFIITLTIIVNRLLNEFMLNEYLFLTFGTVAKSNFMIIKQWKSDHFSFWLGHQVMSHLHGNRLPWWLCEYSIGGDHLGPWNFLSWLNSFSQSHRYSIILIKLIMSLCFSISTPWSIIHHIQCRIHLLALLKWMVFFYWFQFTCPWNSFGGVWVGLKFLSQLFYRLKLILKSWRRSECLLVCFRLLHVYILTNYILFLGIFKTQFFIWIHWLVLFSR